MTAMRVNAVFAAAISHQSRVRKSRRAQVPMRRSSGVQNPFDLSRRTGPGGWNMNSRSVEYEVFIGGENIIIREMSHFQNLGYLHSA